MLAGCPAFWSSSDVPVLSRHVARNSIQQLQHQVTAFIESVRSATRWSRERQISPSTKGSVVDNNNVVRGAGDHQHIGIEAGAVDQTALFIVGPQDHGEGDDFASPHRDGTVSSELTHGDPVAGATLAYRDVAVTAALETASPPVFYLHQRHTRALQDTLCVVSRVHCTVHGTDHSRPGCSATCSAYTTMYMYGRQRGSAAA